MQQQQIKTFTGLRRKRQTSRRVLLADIAAKFCITFGGLGTIVAVLTVCIFLAWVVVPLFEGASVSGPASIESAKRNTLHLTLDEYGRLGCSVLADGTLSVFRADTGTTLYETRLTEGKITAHSFLDRTGTFVLGFDDGTFSYGRLRFSTAFFDPKKETALNAAVGSMGIVVHEWEGNDVDEKGEPVKVKRKGLVDRIPTGELRGLYLTSMLMKPRKAGESAVKMVDHVLMADESPSVLACTSDAQGPVQLFTSRKVTNTVTGVDELRFARGTEVPVKEATPPAFLRIGSTATNIFLAWEDGKTLRFRYSPPDVIELAETLDLVPSPAGKLTALEFAIGKDTLVAGHADGTLQGWFTVAFDGSTVGYKPIFFKSPDQQRKTNPHLWVFREGSAELDEFLLAGDLETKVVRDNAMKGGITLVSSDQKLIDEYLAAIPIDGRKLVKAKDLPAGGAAVTMIAPGQRGRLIVAGFADGAIGLYHITSESRLAQITDHRDPLRQVAIGAKDDSFIALTDKQLHRWQMQIAHPEASVDTLFNKVWYEGYAVPEHMWQSTAGEDSAESKYGLRPLIFGTLKATFYSMLFAVPLALLAAIYTSEFLHPRVKARMKPAIEMMASLPSVVLGFIAAVWLAPLVEQHLAGVLAVFITIPVAFLIGAYLWQLLPYDMALRLRPWRLLFVVLTLPVGFVMGTSLVGPVLEHLLYLGDVRRFLHGSHRIPKVGNLTAAWMLILLPISSVLVAFLFGRVVTPIMRGRAANWTRSQAAIYDLIKFLVGVVAVVLVAWMFSFVLGGIMGGDPRGKDSIIDSYDPRNALVVGFIMGFAVIPIIYTIAEDAMSTVPDHLRAASLGAGATQWQTAIRIVIPTAMSGLFSACMIGLGRAVGETMIVLMAAGGTAVMDYNVFNGFRTLSANIATELPEAPVNSTHYRTLFLAGLVLFAMTFVVNTFAEAVRQRFRKRAFQL